MTETTASYEPNLFKTVGIRTNTCFSPPPSLSCLLLFHTTCPRTRAWQTPFHLLSKCAKETVPMLTRCPIHLQHDWLSGKWSPISRDIITHGSSLRPHSVQLSMESGAHHSSLPSNSLCVCVCRRVFALQYGLNDSLSQHIKPLCLSFSF